MCRICNCVVGDSSSDFTDIPRTDSGKRCIGSFGKSRTNIFLCSFNRNRCHSHGWYNRYNKEPQNYCKCGISCWTRDEEKRRRKQGNRAHTARSSHEIHCSGYDNNVVNNFLVFLVRRNAGKYNVCHSRNPSCGCHCISFHDCGCKCHSNSGK